MAGVPSPDRIDAATLGVMIGLLVFAYVIVPHQIVQFSARLAIIMLFVCWTGYFCYRAMFGKEDIWE
jgi:hypothetical protein